MAIHGALFGDCTNIHLGGLLLLLCEEVIIPAYFLMYLIVRPTFSLILCGLMWVLLGLVQLLGYCVGRLFPCQEKSKEFTVSFLTRSCGIRVHCQPNLCTMCWLGCLWVAQLGYLQTVWWMASWWSGFHQEWCKTVPGIAVIKFIGNTNVRFISGSSPNLV